MWSSQLESFMVSYKGADLELDSLANGKPMKGVSDEGRDMGEICDVIYETGSSIENRLKFRCIS